MRELRFVPVHHHHDQNFFPPLFNGCRTPLGAALVRPPPFPTSESESELESEPACDALRFLAETEEARDSGWDPGRDLAASEVFSGNFVIGNSGLALFADATGFALFET